MCTPKAQNSNKYLNIKPALEFAKYFHQPFAIVQIDFFKTFDSISHQFLLKTTFHFKIPFSMLKYI